MTSLPDWLHKRAPLSPDRLALVADGVRWTFRQLDERVTAAAAWLRAREMDPGARVALLARNSAAYVVLVHAVSRAGAVLVPLNTRLSAPELAWQAADSGARLLLADDAHAAAAADVQAATPGLRVARLEDAAAGAVTAAPLEAIFDLASIHSLIYTSGTTGRPKGAQLTFGNHWWSATGSALNLGLRADDVWLACLPLFHVGGLAIVLRGAIYGMTVVVQAGFDPAAVNAALAQERVTIISVVSAMLRRMLDAQGEAPFPAAVRCVLLGGGPAPQPLLEDCAARGLPVVQTYGLTEAASQVATLAPEDALRKLGSAGQPLLPTQLKIEDPDASGAGEIIIRGPTLTPGYHGRPEATAHAWRGGWFHTGDIGRLDAAGYLYVLDRRDDLIISGGENVYPAEVEAVLLAHPAVAEAGVAGRPDARWGQVPAAWVVLRAGLTADEPELRAFCQARLARYKVPARVTFADALPRNAAGKLLRRQL
ncbi:MAG: o-succinylbenzoate--CoA ligase [Anaerolineales bacterium]|nr:o-succinylbenzoate--CoA ligase [Anaerolineales bacterium]